MAKAAYIADDVEWETYESGDNIGFGDQPTTVTALPQSFDTEDADITVRLQSRTIDDVRTYTWLADITYPQEFSADSGASTEFTADAPALRVLSSAERAFVFAAVPRAGGDGATLTVFPSDADPIVVPLRDIEPAFDVFGAATTFVQPGPFSAVITAADGSVLATWPEFPAP
jgi:hypothetical protein